MHVGYGGCRTYGCACGVVFCDISLLRYVVHLTVIGLISLCQCTSCNFYLSAKYHEREGGGSLREWEGEGERERERERDCQKEGGVIRAQPYTLLHSYNVMHISLHSVQTDDYLSLYKSVVYPPRATTRLIKTKRFFGTSSNIALPVHRILRTTFGNYIQIARTLSVATSTGTTDTSGSITCSTDRQWTNVSITSL